MRGKCRFTAMIPGLALLSMQALAGSPAVDVAASKVGLQLSQSLSGGGNQAGQRPAPQGGEYRIDTGDSVSVTVYQEPDLSISGAKVSTDGTVAFPLLGDVQVAGLSSKQLQKLITERLADGYLKSPSVTVSIDRYRLYYINGEVNSPGGYSFVDGLTVEKAVALAGGYTERASKEDITLVRESHPDQPVKSVPSTAAIQPGDVITVGESFF